MINENILTINYNKGHFNVDLSKFLPCSQKDFKMVLSMVDRADDPVSIAGELLGYIDGQLTKEAMYSYCMINRVKVESYEKKMNALRNILIDTYELTVEPIEKKAEQPKAKKAVVYKMNFNNGVKSIECVPGWTFEKAGYTFTVHKSGRYYIVSLYGVSVGGNCYHTNKAAAIASIDSKILDIFAKNPEKLEIVKNDFEKLMIEAGYMDEPIVKDPETIPAESEAAATTPAEIETTTMTPAEVKTDPTEVETVQTEITGPVETKAQEPARGNALLSHVIFFRFICTNAHYREDRKSAMRPFQNSVGPLRANTSNDPMMDIGSILEAFWNNDHYTRTSELYMDPKSTIGSFYEPPKSAMTTFWKRSKSAMEPFNTS